MKKLIIILTVFVLILGFSVFEMVYTERVFETIAVEVSAIHESVTGKDAAADTPQNRAHLETAENKWNGCRSFVLSVMHHNLARTMDERLANLRAWIEMDNAEEVRVAAAITLALTDDLKDEALINISNLM